MTKLDIIVQIKTQLSRDSLDDVFLITACYYFRIIEFASDHFLRVDFWIKMYSFSTLFEWKNLTSCVLIVSWAVG